MNKFTILGMLTLLCIVLVAIGITLFVFFHWRKPRDPEC